MASDPASQADEFEFILPTSPPTADQVHIGGQTQPVKDMNDRHASDHMLATRTPNEADHRRGLRWAQDSVANQSERKAGTANEEGKVGIGRRTCLQRLAGAGDAWRRELQQAILAQPVLPVGQRRAAELCAAHDLIEQALIVDILVQVLPPFLAHHRLAPRLYHREASLCAPEIDDACV